MKKKILLIFLVALSSFKYFYQPRYGRVHLHKKLAKVPYADQEGVIIGTKVIELEGIDQPYNASIVGNDDGTFSMSFRYDIRRLNTKRMERISKLTGLVAKKKYYNETYIGMVELDEDLNPIPGTIRTLNTGSLFSEDARLFAMGDESYLIYNDLESIAQINARTMRLAKLNREKTELLSISNLDQNLSIIEKNWTPFALRLEGEQRIGFEYFINPHKIFYAHDSLGSSLGHMVFPRLGNAHTLVWERKWGALRGGTPAYMVDGEYLGFFHTLFPGKRKKEDISWYLMGAYTFSPEQPFQLTRCSQLPFLFNDIFSSKKNGALPQKLRCIYPAGFALQTINGREVIHVSCGENDCAIKIITFDKEKLLRSLPKVEPLDRSEYYFERGKTSKRQLRKEDVTT